MATVLLGKTKCGICGLVLKESDKIIAFPAFAHNELDELLMFNDAGFHESCVINHELGPAVLARIRELYENTGSGHRKCTVCKQEVLDPDDYTLIPYLTSCREHPLFPINYTHLHKSCLSKWNQRERVIALLQNYQESGAWQGPFLKKLLKELGASGGTIREFRGQHT